MIKHTLNLLSSVALVVYTLEDLVDRAAARKLLNSSFRELLMDAEKIFLGVNIHTLYSFECRISYSKTRNSILQDVTHLMIEINILLTQR